MLPPICNCYVAHADCHSRFLLSQVGGATTLAWRRKMEESRDRSTPSHERLFGVAAEQRQKRESAVAQEESAPTRRWDGSLQGKGTPLVKTLKGPSGDETAHDRLYQKGMVDNQLKLRREEEDRHLARHRLAGQSTASTPLAYPTVRLSTLTLTHPRTCPHSHSHVRPRSCAHTTARLHDDAHTFFLQVMSGNVRDLAPRDAHLRDLHLARRGQRSTRSRPFPRGCTRMRWQGTNGWRGRDRRRWTRLELGLPPPSEHTRQPKHTAI